MKPLTLTESFDHFEYACRAAILIQCAFILAFLVEYFIPDVEVEA